MKLTLVALCAAALTSPVSAQTPARPAVTPAFTPRESSPSFVVECFNTTAAPVSWSTVDVGLALRVDGRVHDLQGGLAGSMILNPGEVPEVTPGESRRILLVLQQRAAVTTSPGRGFRARVRRGWMLPLEPGDHRLAVRCLGNWSDDVLFSWDGDGPLGQ